MKELNDYKAEIFRRSEQKKRQIKKRRRIALGVGVPLCLCCVIAVAAISNFPLAMKGNVAMDAAPECGSPMVSEDILMTVRWQDLELWVDDPEIAAQWEQLLTDWPVEAGKEELNRSELADMIPPEDYVITLYLDGEADRYRVTGNRLYREATGQSRELTPDELSRLEALVDP